MKNPLEEINSIAHLLPLPVLQDINQRIGDWLASGGKETDPYIEQQLRFARRFAQPNCTYINNETIDIPGTDESITICHDCGYEL